MKHEREEIIKLIKNINKEIETIEEDAINTDKENLDPRYRVAMGMTLAFLKDAENWAGKMLNAVTLNQSDKKV